MTAAVKHALEHAPGCTCPGPHRAKRSRPGRYVRIAEGGKKRKRAKPSIDALPFVAADGEGSNDGDGRHQYKYLAAVDERGKLRGEVAHPRGIGSSACFEFLLSLGTSRVFMYGANYDVAHWLTDLPAAKTYELLHPELRRRHRFDPITEDDAVRDFTLRRKVGLCRECAACEWPAIAERSATHRIHTGDPKMLGKLFSVVWGGYRLNYVRGELNVQRVKWVAAKRRYVTVGKRVTVWDVMRFFQGKFTETLKSWQLGEGIAEIERMKAKRGSKAWNADDPEVHDYCKAECRALAQLVRKLVSAHERCGLKLKRFHGAGSTGSALLEKLGVRQFMAPQLEEMREPVASAFFGGRFEITRAGPVTGELWSYDLKSAYPAIATGLPCLKCGTWTRVVGRNLERRIERARLALVETHVASSPEAWGPLPWRSPDGTILFPRTCFRTWTWRAEYLAARAYAKVEPIQAWIYDCDCSHAPFAGLAQTYRDRCQLIEENDGDAGAGIIYKLGPNSVYGQLARSVGQAKHRSWIWAGCITSGVRAALLERIASVRDGWDILSVATDGLISRRRMRDLPAPPETGTGDLPAPLGSWAEERLTGGVHVCRPGIYFPRSPTAEQLKDVKARGLGKGSLLSHAAKIEAEWAKSGPAGFPVDIKGGRFVGASSGIHLGPKGEPTRSDDYGQWIDFTVDVSYKPTPKRSGWLDDHQLEAWSRKPKGRSDDEGLRATTTAALLTMPSAPYKRAVRSPDARALEAFDAIASEQDGEGFGAFESPEEGPTA